MSSEIKPDIFEIRRNINIVRGIKDRRDTILKRIEMGRLSLPKAVLKALDSADISKSDLDAVAELLVSKNEKEKIAAALCIKELIGSFNNIIRTRPCRISKATHTLLLNAIQKGPCEVQYHLLQALRNRHFANADEVFPVLIEHLHHKIEKIQLAALSAIQSYGVDLGSRHVSEIAKLVSRPISDVQIRACQVLASFEIDALEALPTLLDGLKNNCDGNVRTQLAITLSAIDPEGKRLIAIKEVAIRNTLVNELRKQGESGRSLRQKLSEHWRTNEGLDQSKQIDEDQNEEEENENSDSDSKDPTYLDINFNIESRILSRDGFGPKDGSVLTSILSNLFNILFKVTGEVVSYEMLSHAWPPDSRGTTDDSNVQRQISRLNDILEIFELEAHCESGIGYSLRVICKPS